MTTEPILTTGADWWRNAVVYQIYPRSFADSNGDGIGDLVGIAEKVPYLKDLGVDAVWLSPFYPSALADGGYDVDDYRNVDPKIGTLAEFDAMVAAFHDTGIKVIVDIVPNHSSDRHEWFQAALASPKGSPERDRYIFRDGAGPNQGQPPSDWKATFGGPAWEPVGDGQFYFHLFAPEQPDWNWDNREVRDYFLQTLRFWADRGVDGFRVDVAHGLAKDFSADPLPTAAELREIEGGPNHPYYDRDEVDDIYAEWREVFNSYDPPRSAVAEVWVDVPERRARYATQASLGQAFNFDLLRANFRAPDFKKIVAKNLESAGETNSSSTWVLSNHDVVRHVSRYSLPLTAPDSPFIGEGPTWDRDRAWLISGGTEPIADRELGHRRAKAATGFILALPGSAYIYQGEELGLPEVVEIPDADRQDPAFYRSAGYEVGRDGCRVPIPWTPDDPWFGFSGSASQQAFASKPHLPQPEWFADYAVSAAESDPDSTLAFYRKAIALRKALAKASPQILEWLDSPADTLHFSRGPWHCFTNFGEVGVPLPSGGALLLASGDLKDNTVPGATTVWFEERQA
ncbi:MAG: glycoside hydrolase family 13 protein [Propionibacteriaceae bacterium]|jgi:alpha-glucosidase|nr:glycoside hydrolase family 13 protein [Propionibacteriaceae bacterium]